MSTFLSLGLETSSVLVCNNLQNQNTEKEQLWICLRDLWCESCCVMSCHPLTSRTPFDLWRFFNLLSFILRPVLHKTLLSPHKLWHNPKHCFIKALFSPYKCALKTQWHKGRNLRPPHDTSESVTLQYDSVLYPPIDMRSNFVQNLGESLLLMQ